MTMWKKLMLWTVILCLTLTCAQAAPMEYDDWYETLARLVNEVGNRQVYTQGSADAVAWLEERFNELGYSYDNGLLSELSMETPGHILTATGWTDGLTDLIAVKPALNPDPAIVIVCAHYDCAPGTVGAKDNGSGIAAMLTLVRALGEVEAFPDTELRFIAMGGEEAGEVGSYLYVEEMPRDEKDRTLGVFNIDLITVDEGAVDVALSCDTLGARTSDGGYVEGSSHNPVHNRVSLAFEKALWEVGGFSESDRGVTFCVPRHLDMSDHLPFHEAGIDAANLAFRGNVAQGGFWPSDMHTPEDALKPFDRERTQQALDIIYQAVYGLCSDHSYGLDLQP